MRTLKYLRLSKYRQQNKLLASAVLKKSVLLFVGFIILVLAHGQDKKLLVQADQYFSEGEYLTAAHLYQQYLYPAKRKIPASGFPLNSKKNTSVKTAYTTTMAIELKQAESYRLANYWNEAAALYLKSYEKDQVNNDTALYWYAVCQRNLGNFALAESNIDRFLNESASNIYKLLAEKEKSTLQFIKNQVRRPDSLRYQIQKFAPTSTIGKGDYAPIVTGESQVLFTGTQTDPIAVAGVNPNHNRLFQTILQNGNLQNIAPLSIEGMDTSMNQGAASLSSDGKTLYFTQWSKVKGQNVSSIYYARKNGVGWSQAVLLSLVNQKGYSSKQPYITPNGQYLFFASNREGGHGSYDIWYAPILNDGITGEPLNAGSTINTPANEQSPFYHASTQTLVFSSDRSIGMGGYDLFSAIGKETMWEQPENMGYPINSPRDDIYFFASPEEPLLHSAFISSDRGTDCCLTSFVVTKAEKKKMMTGFVRDCETNELLTGAEVQLKDAMGNVLNNVTNLIGQYSFDMGRSFEQWNVTKEGYLRKAGPIVIARIDKSSWLMDTLYNEAVCIEKEKIVIKIENVVTLYFDFDQSSLKERGVTQMDSIYAVLIEIPTATIQVSGYADGRGSEVYNQKLSDKRARSCANYLIKKGIDASRISFESFGSCCPVEMELINGRDNPDGRSSNRRALINIKKN